MSQQMSFTIATIFAPHNVQQISSDPFFIPFGILMFLSGSAHHWVHRGDGREFAQYPIGAGLSPSGAVLPVLLGLLGKACLITIQLAFGQLGNDLVQVIRVLGAR
jgi:flagellar biosynthesis protein FliR